MIPFTLKSAKTLIIAGAILAILFFAAPVQAQVTQETSGSATAQTGTSEPAGTTDGSDASGFDPDRIHTLPDNRMPVPPGERNPSTTITGPPTDAPTILQISANELLINHRDVSVKSSAKIEMKAQKLIMETAQGEKEIKVMPSVASEIAINQLKLKNYEIELKDVGKPVYEIKGIKEGRIFGIFKASFAVQTQVDAETGAVEKTQKPWWSFLLW